MIRGYNEFLNDLHATGQITGNQVQNLGLSVLSQVEVFDGRQDLPRMINREFRMLLTRARPYRDRFDGFLDEISQDILITIRDLISCDDRLEEDFNREVTTDLARGRACAALNPGTDAPVPS